MTDEKTCKHRESEILHGVRDIINSGNILRQKKIFFHILSIASATAVCLNIQLVFSC